MRIESPLAFHTDLVSYTISVDGVQLPSTCLLAQLRVHKEVNRIPQARVMLYDGDPAGETFALSAGKTLLPGAALRVSVGYNSEESLLFEGVIVKHGLKVRGDGRACVVLTCYDKALQLTLGRKSASLGKTDSDIMSALIGAAGLAADVEATSALHDGVVRYYATDWDFLVSRAEMNGKIVLVEGGTVKVAAPKCDGDAVLRIGYGDALQEIDAEIDARSQYGAVSCEAWDYTAQKVVTASASEPSVNQQGNLTGKKLAEVLGSQTMRLQSATPVPDAELKVWADAQLLKARLARMRGQVRFRGNVKPVPGCLVELDGLGERFNGQAFVARVVHLVEDGDWTTELGFGLAPGWFVEQTPEVAAPLASGMTPGIGGLQIGVVRKIDSDPDGQARIQVDVPMVGLEGEGIWARMASGYATKDSGIFFVPEVGDEVVLGFLNGNPGFPVVLGSLYSGKHVAPFTADAQNTNKAIVTNGKLKILLDDVKKNMTIETPGGHKIMLHDENTTLTVTDKVGNKVELSQSGLVLSSPGAVTITATGKLSLHSDVAVSIDAPKVQAKADVALTLHGQTSAEFSSSGKATVRGALVTIN